MAALHTHRFQVEPGGTDPNSGAGNNYCFAWGGFNSQTTLQAGNNDRTIAWSSGNLYTGLKIFALWSWKPVQGRAPGRVLNFHNHPNFGGWEPDNSNGVSAIALDWLADRVWDNGVNGLVLSLQAESTRIDQYSKKWQVYSVAEMDAAIAAGTWLDIVLEIDIGIHPNGRVQCWAGGADTPKFDTGPVSTRWPSQTGFALYDGGMYNSSGLTAYGTHIMESVPARIGRTLAEALQDGVNWPITETHVWGSMLKTNPTVPNYTHTVIASRTTEQFVLPASLGGTPGDPVPDADPPTVDYWFGNQTLGTLAGTTGINGRRGSAFLATEDGDVTDVYMLMEGATGLVGDSSQFKVAIRSMSGSPASGGLPMVKLGESAEVTILGNDVDAWKQFHFTPAVRVNAGNWYHLDNHAGGAVAVGAIVWWTAPTGGWFFYHAGDVYADGSDETFGTITDSDNRLLCMFAAYDLIPPEPPPPESTNRIVGGTRAGGSKVESLPGRVAGRGGGGI